MARKLRDSKTAEEIEAEEGPKLDATQRANVCARRDFLLSQIGAISTIETKISALQAQIKPLRKEIGDKFRLLKTELGYDRTYVETIRNIIDMEEEKRDTALDQLREIYGALAPGEQASFLDAMEQPGSAEELERATIEGKSAGLAGANFNTNNYDEKTQRAMHSAWSKGWNIGQESIAKKFGMDRKKGSGKSKGGEEASAVA